MFFENRQKNGSGGRSSILLAARGFCAVRGFRGAELLRNAGLLRRGAFAQCGAFCVICLTRARFVSTLKEEKAERKGAFSGGASTLRSGRTARAF